MVDPSEDERPGHIGGKTYDFGIGEIAEAEEDCAEGKDNGEAVEQPHDALTGEPRMNGESDDEGEGRPVAGHAPVAGEHKPPVGRPRHGEKYLQGVAKIIGGLVEEAMAEPGPEKKADDGDHDKLLEACPRQPLAGVHPPQDDHAKRRARDEKQAVPRDG